jgi:hypothetical protein
MIVPHPNVSARAMPPLWKYLFASWQLNRRTADQLAQLHDRVATGRWDRPELLRDPVRHPLPLAAEVRGEQGLG